MRVIGLSFRSRRRAAALRLGPVQGSAGGSAAGVTCRLPVWRVVRLGSLVGAAAAGADGLGFRLGSANRFRSQLQSASIRTQPAWARPDLPCPRPIAPWPAQPDAADHQHPHRALRERPALPVFPWVQALRGGDGGRGCLTERRRAYPCGAARGAKSYDAAAAAPVSGPCGAAPGAPERRAKSWACRSAESLRFEVAMRSRREAAIGIGYLSGRRRSARRRRRGTEGDGIALTRELIGAGVGRLRGLRHGRRQRSATQS